MHKSNKKHQPPYIFRIAKPEEFTKIGELMVEVYSQLDGFPKPLEQPDYYRLLAQVGNLTAVEKTDILVAVSESGMINGAVVYFGDMKDYGSGGTATKEKNACGFRLLAVAPNARGQGLGKALTEACIEKGKSDRLHQMIIHTTAAMQRAWKMYEGFGFQRSEDLDFLQGELQVFGFRLLLR